MAQADAVPPVIVPPPPTAAGIMARTLTARPAITWSGRASRPDPAVSGSGLSADDPLIIDRTNDIAAIGRITMSQFFDIPDGVTAVYSSDLVRETNGQPSALTLVGLNIEYGTVPRLRFVLEGYNGITDVLEVVLFAADNDNLMDCETFPFWMQVIN